MESGDIYVRLDYETHATNEIMHILELWGYDKNSMLYKNDKGETK